MSRAAAENEDLAHGRFPVTCVHKPAHSRANEEFDRVRGGGGGGGGGEDRLYIARAQYCIWG